MRKVGLSLFFLWCSCQVFVSLFFISSFKTDDKCFSLYFWNSLLLQPYGHAVFSVGKFLHIQFLKYLFVFSDFVSLSILISCVFLGICSFHVIFKIHGVRIVNSFIVCEILSITVLFILNWDLCLLWLSVIHLAERSVIYFSFFRKLTVLIFLSYICFLLKVFCSSFCYFFSPTLGFFPYFLFFDRNIWLLYQLLSKSC